MRSTVEGEGCTSIYWLYNRAKRNLYSGLSLRQVALKFLFVPKSYIQFTLHDTEFPLIIQLNVVYTYIHVCVIYGSSSPPWVKSICNMMPIACV